jgi:hypothetical protein
MTVPFIVIARSEARKQSCIEIATPPLREARNDKKVDCHGFPSESLAMTKIRLSRLPFGSHCNEKRKFVSASLTGSHAMKVLHSFSGSYASIKQRGEGEENLLISLHRGKLYI